MTMCPHGGAIHLCCYCQEARAERLEAENARLKESYESKIEDFGRETLKLSVLCDRLRDHGHRDQPRPKDCWICLAMQEARGTRQTTALTHAERERDAARAALQQAVEALCGPADGSHQHARDCDVGRIDPLPADEMQRECPECGANYDGMRQVLAAIISAKKVLG